MFWEQFVSLCKQNGTTPGAVCRELGYSNATPTHWKKGVIPKSDKLIAIAEYFNVPADFLQGKGSMTNPALTDDDIKFALFNGSEGVTDEMYEEVKQFAAMVKLREEQKRGAK